MLRILVAMETEKGPQNNEIDIADTFKLSLGSELHISLIVKNGLCPFLLLLN